MKEKIKINKLEEKNLAVRSGFLYDANISINGQTMDIRMDLNHKISTEGYFEKRPDWNYKHWPLEVGVIDMIPLSNKNRELVKEIIKTINENYREQEKEWQREILYIV